MLTPNGIAEDNCGKARVRPLFAAVSKMAAKGIDALGIAVRLPTSQNGLRRERLAMSVKTVAAVVGAAGTVAFHSSMMMVMVMAAEVVVVVKVVVAAPVSTLATRHSH